MAASDQDGVDVERLYAAHAAAVDFYRNQLNLHSGPREYLAQRGFPHLVRDDQPWHVGYAPPGGITLTTHLTDNGYQRSELLAAGLATTSRSGAVIDRFRDRIIFPIRNPLGHVVAFTGRAAPHAAPHIPKYLNSPDTTIFHKGQTLYGYAEQTCGPDAAPVLVEGTLDVHAIQLAYPDASHIGLAPCGTALTRQHADLLHTLPAATNNGIVVAFDSDHPGQAATERAWRLLHPYRVSLYAIRLPDGTDPASLTTHPRGTAALRTALAEKRPLIGAVLDIHLHHLIDQHPDLLDHVDGRVLATRALATLVTDLDPTEVARLLGYIAERTGVGIDTTATVIVDALETAAQNTAPAHGAESNYQPTPRNGPTVVPIPPRPPAAARAFIARDQCAANAPSAPRSPTIGHEQGTHRHGR